MGILSGLRVIDCGTYIAGPAAAAVLSDFGAGVIKIERPPYGDPYRYLPLVPGMPEGNTDYCWLLDGRNKRSLGLNLKAEGGREILLRLVGGADVFITNYQPGLAAQFQVRWEDLHPLNPRLIYAYVTGYGEAGEGAGAPGYDATAYWARSGLMATMHYADSDPCQSPAGFGDHPTAMTLVSGILLALIERQKTGVGMKVSTSLMANGAWSNACQIQAALCGARFVPRWTRGTTVNPLVNHYLSKDGVRFFLCLLDPAKDWTNFCRAIGRGDLIYHERFSTPALRTENGRELIAMIDRAMAEKDAAEWKRIFAAHEVIWGPVPESAQVAEDAQMAANGVFTEIEGTGLRTVNNPVNLECVQKETPRMAPGVGEHTREILLEIGYADAEIDGLMADGVVSAPLAKTADTDGHR
jgi:crotonobetainyl-CoA:carnitine CoA-transferase CaiB-like acyl-CoA transferase